MITKRMISNESILSDLNYVVKLHYDEGRPIIKSIRSLNYCYDFFYHDGKFMRWGQSKEDDPGYSPFGPEILDIEVSTVCTGIKGIPCKHCYKSNTDKERGYMSLTTFCNMFKTFPLSLTQIAFGIGSLQAHPMIYNMMDFCRINKDNPVIPNITINGDALTDKHAELLAKYCGAVSVSNYDKDTCYTAVNKLTSAGLEQVNIHQLVSQETYQQCLNLLADIPYKSRLSELNAVVFLLLKPKGRGQHYHLIEDLKWYKHIITIAMDYNSKGIKVGFDSCFAPIFLQVMKEQYGVDSEQFKQYNQYVECCESTLFSGYINVEGKFFPCSFLEGEEGWEEGIDVVNCNDFVKDVWYNERVVAFRDSLLKQDNSEISKTCRLCPKYKELYKVIGK